MKVAAIQMVSTPSVERNLDAARTLVKEAAALGAHLIVLPEYFCLLGHHERDKLAVAEVDGAGPIQTALAAMARQHRAWIVGGTLPMRLSSSQAAAPSDANTDRTQRVRNASCVHGPDGERVARYDKIHLFAFDNGQERYDEGRTLEAGSEPTSFVMSDDAVPQGPTWRVGMSTCYDLRFPELYRALSPPHALCDVVVVPSAFTHTTGQAHWEVLLRARAIENQCYVIAAAQGGVHENGRKTFGHSLIVDPWGATLAVKQDAGEGVVVADIDRERMQDVRTRLPAWRHRVIGHDPAL